MKISLLLIISLLFCYFGFTQNTTVPGPNFEKYLERHDASGNIVSVGDPNSMGDGIDNNQNVFTNRIISVLNLDVSNRQIFDLKGIEDFQSLKSLNCSENTLNFLGLTENATLKNLKCTDNILTALDLSDNLNLLEFSCDNNLIEILDLSANTFLYYLRCSYNKLEELNVQNGNNSNFTQFNATNNPDLFCIEVDNPLYSTTNWTNIDAQTSFNLNCANMETYVPDDNFEAYLEANSMGNGIANDNYVTTANINTVINLDVSYLNISDLTGIEDFTNLKYLNCYTNQLNSLDVSSNTNLIDLWCGYNNLTTINTATLNLLEDFRVNNNSITSFDTSNNLNLKHFGSSYNPINSLNISLNINLEYLDCQNNLLNTIDISQNPLLTNFACGNNNITTLDVSNNSQLTSLECRNNNLTSLNLNTNLALEELIAWSNNITNLDVHLNTNLYQLHVENNDLYSLNFKNGNNLNTTDFYFRSHGNPNLTCIEVDNSTYSTANWTQVDATSTFSAHCPLGETYVPDDNFENYLETHDANGNVVAVGNALSMGNGIANDDYVTTANINTVTSLNVSNLSISQMIGIEDFILIENLYCSVNQLTSLDVTQNIALIELNCAANQLASIDITNNVSLVSFWCYGNSLTSLDITQNIALFRLICMDNQLSNIDTSQNIALWNFWCYNNQLTDLDLSQNINLFDLWCSNNLLTSLNVKNGNNGGIYSAGFKTYNNPNLLCINVDNPNYSDTNWTNIDPASSFSNDCPNLCSYPTNLSVSTITTTGVTLEWQENGTATTWDLEIGIQGFTPTGNPTDNDVNKPYSWSNGQANASYDYYVRADCNADNIDVSIWVGPFSFSTINVTVCESGFELVGGTPFTNAYQSTIAFSDIDGDNDQDVLITGRNPLNQHQKETKLYFNDGLGNFIEAINTPFIGVGTYGHGIAFADIDGDSDQDVIITGQANLGYRVTKLYTNNGFGTFNEVFGTPFIGVEGSTVAFSDIDNDNDQDVLITGRDSSNQIITKLYINNGLGIYTVDTINSFENIWFSSINFADIDNDNDEDVIISGRNILNQSITKLYKNDGSGSFNEVLGTTFIGVELGDSAFADIDNDNDLDFLITGWDRSINQRKSELYVNDGLGNFTLVPGTLFEDLSQSSIAFADIDNDYDQDVLITGSDFNNQPNSKLYINDGLGNYTLEVSTPFAGVLDGDVGFADIDSDGDQDILITGQNTQPFSVVKLYKNNLTYDTTYTTTGWTNGTPTLNKCVVIDQDYTTTSFSAYKTTVNANKTLTIAANTYMQVQKSIENNGTIIIEPTGSIVQIDNTATVTGTGTFNTKIATTPLQDDTRFTYFSSPTKDETLNAFATWADMGYIWEFNQYIQDWTHIPNTATIMQSGNGYILRGNSSNTYPNYLGLTNFQNIYNNGIITQNLNFKGDGSPTANLDNDSNLVGNPYPSAINGTKLLNPILNPTAGTLYFWTHNSAMVAGDFSTDDYAIWNLSGGTTAISGGTAPTGYIASGQGFFIDAEGDETLTLGQNEYSTLTFNNEMRETGNNTDFRVSENTEHDKIWLNLSNNNGVFNQTLIAFLPNATTNYDLAYEGKRSNNGVATLYSVGLENQHYGIQALPVLQEDTIVPLGYQIENENIQNLKISIDHLENMQDVTVYLEDNLLNVVHNLNQQDYNFTVTDTGIFNARFQLKFTNSSLSIDDISSSINLIASNLNENEILVKTTTNSIIAKINVYDVLGKLIYNAKPQKSIISIPTQNINNGTVLFIKVILENGQTLTKKIIKMM